MKAANNLLKSNNNDPDVKKKMFLKKDETESRRLGQAFEFFFNYTAHIDVVRKNKVELVYFILLPYIKALPKDKK